MHTQFSVSNGIRDVVKHWFLFIFVEHLIWWKFVLVLCGITGIHDNIPVFFSWSITPKFENTQEVIKSWYGISNHVSFLCGLFFQQIAASFFFFSFWLWKCYSTLLFVWHETASKYGWFISHLMRNKIIIPIDPILSYQSFKLNIFFFFFDYIWLEMQSHCEMSVGCWHFPVWKKNTHPHTYTYTHTQNLANMK